MSLRDTISGFLSQALNGGSQEPDGDDDVKKGRILKSWTGLAIVCVAIAIFILTATFLKSVLFGLILAYFLLPFEKFFERRIAPFSKGVDKDSLALRASILTFASIGIGILFATAVALSFAIPAIGKASDRIKDWAASSQTLRQLEKSLISGKDSPDSATAGEGQDGKASDNTAGPPAAKGKAGAFARWAAMCLEEFLEGRSAKQAITSLAVDNRQGIVSGAALLAKLVSSFLFDALLSVFFFFYFVQKMAVFSNMEMERGAGSTGAWLVGGICDSPWMPKTGEEARREAVEAIDRILTMVRTWVRGYLSIILIESCLYISAFLLFRVPYALPLGILAGCTILLPFIGPMASVALTLSVCMAFGGANILTMGGAVASYLVVNGLLEQMFLYPRLIGKALGLTTLETVIVVLLGGLFAGIPGMIFAVPAAAILKYMIPTIYRCWNPHPPGCAAPGK